MSLRKSGNGRPTGTDGSVFSYRMVIDSRYQKILKDLSRWQTSSFDLCKIAAVIVGLLVQVFTIGVTTSLLRNMAPPKRAS